MKITALIIAIVGGLFFLGGYFISKFAKNKKQLYKFSVSLALVVMLGLIFLDLVPEFMENIVIQKNIPLITLGSIAGGILLLFFLDKLVPDHHHEHHEGEKNIKEHQSNMYHIGLVTSVALVLHNIIEGSAIYITSLVDVKAGILIALGVGLHNIPLGIEISTTMDLSKKEKSKKILPLFLMIFSTGLGALIIFVLNINYSSLLLSILIGLTIGMLIYIIVFELLKEVFSNIKEKSTIIGILCGIIILVINMLME